VLAKTLSTPQALVDGIERGVAKTGLAFAEVDLFLHGSTVAINTLLERNGARTALLGFCRVTGLPEPGANGR
jgi:N-methylhydantoinase A